MRTGTVSYRLEDLKKGVIIPIGFVGENDFTRVIFDAEEIYKNYPAAQVSMKVQPPKGGIYPATVTKEENTVIWQVKEADLAHRGSGELQLTFTDGETKIKTYIARTDIKRSLEGNGTAPDPVQDWIDEAEDVLEEVEAAEIHQPIIGLDGYWYTWNQETGEYEKTNTKAQGADVIDDTAGEGDTDKTWSADKLTDEFGSVLNAIQGVSSVIECIPNIIELSFINNKYIDVSVDPVDVNDPKTSSLGYMYSVVECKENDKFVLNGTAGNNPRLWTFIKSNGEIISQASQEATADNLVIVAPALSNYCIVQTKTSGENYKIVAEVKEFSFKIHDDCEPGSVNGTVTNGINLNSSNFTRHRSKNLYKVTQDDVEIVLKFSASDVSSISKVQMIRYNAGFSALEIVEKTTIDSNNSIKFSSYNSYPYFKVLVYHASDVYSFDGVDIFANGSIKTVFHPNIEYATYKAIIFNYVMYGNEMASGRLMLPPNYKMEGKSVPLVVYCHGSGGLTEWTSPMYDSEAREKCFKYLNNEGFAIFDCFPWSQNITIQNSYTYNPFQIPMHIRAYIEGIKYVCSRFNVDVNNVALLCKSQGGNIGHWATVETEFPFRAVGLLAPTTDPVLQKSTEIFYNSYCRQILLDLIDFDGTSTEKQAFVTQGVTSNANVQSFIAKNKGLMVALMPFARGLTNAGSVDTLCDGGFDTLTQTPQWLLDLGLPARESEYDLIPKFAENNDYVKIGQRPVRFWCAIDDAQTSTYANYAIYRYLLNGGSDAEFTFLTIGTGGHNAMDTSELAEKTSGTTSLGIAYSNVPVAYVQIAEYFHRYM